MLEHVHETVARASEARARVSALLDPSADMRRIERQRECLWVLIRDRGVGDPIGRMLRAIDDALGDEYWTAVAAQRRTLEMGDVR